MIVRTKTNFNLRHFAIICGLAAFALFITACGDDSTGTDPEPAKTLTKSQLYNKVWENENGFKHQFQDNGVYQGAGTWRWLNNSDSMEIIQIPNGTPRVWYFYWSTETQMQCSLGNDNEGSVFTVVP